MIWLSLFGLFTFLASCGISYLWWTKVREIRLRQDLFEIRNTLFDAAIRENWTDDLAYQAFREYLNNVLAFAHHLSIPTMIFLSNMPVDQSIFPRSANGKLQKAIEQATSDVMCRIIRFVRRETAIGILVGAARKLTQWARAAEDQQISNRLAPGHFPSIFVAQ